MPVGEKRRSFPDPGTHVCKSRNLVPQRYALNLSSSIVDPRPGDSKHKLEPSQPLERALGSRETTLRTYACNCVNTYCNVMLHNKGNFILLIMEGGFYCRHCASRRKPQCKSVEEKERGKNPLWNIHKVPLAKVYQMGLLRTPVIVYCPTLATSLGSFTGILTVIWYLHGAHRI